MGRVPAQLVFALCCVLGYGGLAAWLLLSRRIPKRGAWWRVGLVLAVGSGAFAAVLASWPT